jgi:hypothetical protein
MVTYTPPGWPAGVHPPGSDDFESTAIGWLLDVVPPDYRLHGVLRRYPVALATMARYHSRACVEGARQGYRTARTELADALPPHAVDTVLAAYRKEGARLAAIARAVGLVERALRGEVFTPAMGDPNQAGPNQAGAEPAGAEQVAPDQAKAKQAKAKQAEAKQAEAKQAEAKQAEAKQAAPKAGAATVKAGKPKLDERPVAARASTGQGGATRGEARRPARPRKAL